MQNTNKAPDRRRPFEQYVGEMEGYLTRQFGLKAGGRGYDLAREYYSQGRSAEFCAYAFARAAGMKFGP
jgi:hypothetical protein